MKYVSKKEFENCFKSNRIVFYSHYYHDLMWGLSDDFYKLNVYRIVNNELFNKEFAKIVYHNFAPHKNINN